MTKPVLGNSSNAGSAASFPPLSFNLLPRRRLTRTSWLTIVTLAIFGPAVTFLFNLSLLAIVYDIIVLSWPKRSE
jgi:hypothetical protein